MTKGMGNSYSMLRRPIPQVIGDNPEVKRKIISPKRGKRMGDALLMSNIPNIKTKEPLVSKSREIGSVVMTDVKDRGLLQQYVDNLYDDSGHSQRSKQLYQVMPSGIWKDRRCFIIGGGPSLKDFNFDILKGEPTITVNRAFEFCPHSSINICQDARVFGYYENKELPEGQEAKDRFEKYKGFKAWLNVQAFPFPEDIYQIGIVHPADFKFENYAGGIPPYNNSGLNALCLAVCLGANPIYLLGFDCKGKNGRTVNFHSGYLDTNEDEVYRDFIKDFNEVAYRIKGKTKVINLNPESGIKCFDFGRIEDVPKIQKPIVVSFYTQNTGYQLEIKRLERSIIRFGLEYDFYAQEDLGTWRANIHDRIRILRHFLDKHEGRDILYIDADGAIQNYPDLFENFEADFGIVKIDRSKYWKDWKDFHEDQYEYLGGTMYLKNNDRIRNLLDLWEKLDKPMETKLSQHTLIKAIQELEGKGQLDVKLLPLTYCQIFDMMADEGEPVVEHFQASRRSILYVKIDEDGGLRLDFGKENRSSVR